MQKTGLVDALSPSLKELKAIAEDDQKDEGNDLADTTQNTGLSPLGRLERSEDDIDPNECISFA